MNDYKNVFIFSFSLLIYVNSNNQRVILNVLLVHTWQSARIINYRNLQATFYTPCIVKYFGFLFGTRNGPSYVGCREECVASFLMNT